MKIEQKRSGYKQSFELINSELNVKYNNLLSSSEWSIHIENIGHKIEVKSYSRVLLNCFGGFFAIILLLALASFFWGDPNNTTDQDAIVGITFSSIFLLILSVTFFIVPQDNNLTIKGGTKDIKFFLNSPTKKEVENFANLLIKKSRKSILDKYSNVETDIPEEDYIRQIYWLYQNGYLNKSEYEEKKNEYRINKLIK